jgi:hypothetical protein
MFHRKTNVKSKVTISVLVPSNSKIEELIESIESLVHSSTSKINYEILIGIDTNNPQKKNILEYFSGDLYKIFTFPNYSYSNIHVYYNELFWLSKGKQIFIWNDNAIMCGHSWNNIKKNNKKIIKFISYPDSRINYFPIIPRKYINKLGILSNHPAIDTYWDIISKIIGQRIEINEISIRHIPRHANNSAEQNQILTLKRKTFYNYSNIEKIIRDASRLSTILSKNSMRKRRKNLWKKNPDIVENSGKEIVLNEEYIIGFLSNP